MQASDDFKMVIVLDESLPVGLLANTAAVLSLSLGGKVTDLSGPDLTDSSGRQHTSLTTIPLPVLKCSADRLRQVYEQSSELKDILVVDVTDAAQTTKNYADYQIKLSSTQTSDLKLLGLALAGSVESIKSLTGNLGLLR